MRERKGLCEDCARIEIRRAFECWGREKEATAKGEEYACTCPPLVCEHEANDPLLIQE